MITGQPFYIKKPVQRSLNKAMRIVKEANQDRLYIVTGQEGSGKSTLAFQLSYFIDPNFCLDDICFNATEFENRIRQKEKFGAVVFDESFNGLSRRSALSGENKKILRLLQESRQRNLIVFIVLPSIFLLESYIIFHRAKGLFHTALYKKNHKKRYFKVFNKGNLKKLYMLGKQTMSYSRPKISKKHDFNPHFPTTINRTEYDKKKLASFRDEDKKKNPEDKKFMIQRDILIKKVHEEYGTTFVDINKWFEPYGVPLNPRYVSRIPLNLPKVTSH